MSCLHAIHNMYLDGKALRWGSRPGYSRFAIPTSGSHLQIEPENPLNLPTLAAVAEPKVKLLRCLYMHALYVQASLLRGFKAHGWT